MQGTPFYTFPGTSRTIDVRTITGIQPAADGSPCVVGKAGGEWLSVDVAEPVAVCAEVSTLMREHYVTANPTEQARVAGKAVGESLALALRHALDMDPHGRTLALGLVAAVRDGFKKIADVVADEIRRKPL
jgi:hypothetical protein